MKIVCVDDKKLILDLTVSMCRTLPQKPDTVGFQSPAEALEWVRRHGADIAILDINMPQMNGITLAVKLKEINRSLAVIFLTGCAEYAVDAFSLHASGYLMKPVSQERLAAEINYASQIIQAYKSLPKSSNIFVNTFGNFDVLVNGEILRFSRSKAKELLAYLVDRRGLSVTRANAFSVLWENQQYNRSMQKQFDVILRSLRATLEQYGIGDILEVNRGSIRVIPEKFDCDLYRFYDGDAQTVNSYRGEYLSEYSWANMTEAYMTARE